MRATVPWHVTSVPQTSYVLAVAGRTGTNLNEEQLRPVFPVLPPVIICRTTEEIVHATIDLIEYPQKLEHARIASRKWIKTYHSGREIVEIQVRVYAEFIGQAERQSEDHATIAG